MTSSYLMALLYLIISSVQCRPNIIFMFGDDMGYNDVQFTSSDLSQPSTDTQTPFLNQLATQEGIVISNYYVHRMCSPTRAAFITGRYSFRYGMETKLLEPDIKVSLTRQVSVLSEEFKAAGYKTHAIGKWHLGFQSWEYTPTFRGFHTFYGYYNAWTDYYSSTYNIMLDEEEYQCFDLRDNEEALLLAGDNPTDYSIYRFRNRAIDVIASAAQDDEPFFLYLAWQSSHTPSEAPQKYYKEYSNSEYPEIRKYNQAQTTSMDAAVHSVVEALKSNGLWENTLLVFSSDNGAAATIGDNFPLRGYKKTVFEGGLRVPAFVSGGYLNVEQRGKTIGEYGEYIHVTDWYPTLLEAAGVKPSYVKSTLRKKRDDAEFVPDWETAEYQIPLDGISIWDQIQHGERNTELSSRLMILDVISDTALDCKNGSVRWGEWKYLKGLGTLDDYDGDDGYLWGDKFADISSSAHLWGQDFANLDIDNALGCDLSMEPTNLMCFYSEDGCLFNLKTDPCEFEDLSGNFPDIFNYLKEHLQNLVMPTDVGLDGDYALTLPSTDAWVCSANENYWTPWQDYMETEFERVLWQDYNEMYGSSTPLESDAEAMTLTSSCNDKAVDGLYYIKPKADGAIIAVICSGGYTMLDASLAYDELSEYFTSMYQYGDNDLVIYGTDCGDSGGWRDWFTPANENTKFRVAQECAECKPGGLHGDNTGYYMTNGYFCPVDLDIDGCSAKKDMTGQTEPDVMCNICDDTDGLCGTSEGRDGDSIYDTSATPAWCDCYKLQLPADGLTTSEHTEYCQNNLNWRPALVMDRSQCTCYKPLDDELQTYTLTADSDLPVVSSQYKSDIVDTLGLYVDDMIVWDTDVDSSSEVDEGTVPYCKKQYTYLSQSDFEFGTYRITKCGNYVLTGDILIHFNKPELAFDYAAGDSPNSYQSENLHWFPTTEQQNSGQYFGLNAFWGPYSIGFMAAITIETNYVSIDLNGFTIAMDYEFYLQQRFFALIELGNKQFEARQGPVDFGRDDLCMKGITIRDGTLGLSSHHGIHGSCAKNVEISNLNIMNFDVTGLQCNGCKMMTIENCKIGPQNTDIPVKGRYTHARIILARLRYLVEEFGDETIQFANRAEATTVRQVADRLIDQMDMVYYHVTQGIEFDDADEEWMAAKQTFMNPTGWMDGGSSYGILLNGFGTAVVNIGRRTTNTFDISVKNVEIHNIKVQPYEGFWAATPTNNGGGGTAIVHGFFFETIDWNQGNIYDADTGYYVGDAYTDILFAANTFFQHDFCPLGSLFYLDGLTQWVFTDEKNVFDADIGLDFRCGSDIQSHSAKGAIGIRIDGVKDFTLEDIYIHNIVNWGDLGSDACGEYEKITFETGVDVDKDIQYGYTGTKVHGILTDYASGSIANVKIEDLNSKHGSVNAIALYKGSSATLSGDININQAIAGSSLTKAQVDALILPNPPPFVCSIFIGPNSDSQSNPQLTPDISTSDDFTVSATNLYGYDYCTATARVGGMDEVAVPESLITATHEDIITINNGFFPLMSNTIETLLLLFASFICAVIILFVYKKRNKTNKLKSAAGNTTLTANYGSI